MLNLSHPNTDITWEIISGAIRGVYIGTSVMIFVYFILCVLDYVDVIDISPWAHILTWTLFSVISAILAIVHLGLSYSISEPSESLSTTVIQNLCISILVTLASIIVYVESDNRIESTNMTTGMTQFFDRRKHFFLIILILASVILFSNSTTLAVLYRK